MIGFRTTAIKFQDQEILSFLKIFNRSCFNIITAIEKFISIMAEFIKYILKIFIDLVVKIGKMSTAVMIAGI